MGLKRNVSLSAALRYQGPAGYLAFLLHRIGGVGMGVFLTVHILSALLNGKAGAFLNGVYEHWAFQVFIFFCVLFHAINGLRITLLDLFPKLLEYQTEAIWIEWAVFLPVFGVAAYTLIATGLGG